MQSNFQLIYVVSHTELLLLHSGPLYYPLLCFIIYARIIAQYYRHIQLYKRSRCHFMACGSYSRDLIAPRKHICKIQVIDSAILNHLLCLRWNKFAAHVTVTANGTVIFLLRPQERTSSRRSFEWRRVDLVVRKGASTFDRFLQVTWEARNGQSLSI